MGKRAGGVNWWAVGEVGRIAVIPAKVGLQTIRGARNWIPAFAGMAVAIDVTACPRRGVLGGNPR
jgi:hypothetical protein